MREKISSGEHKSQNKKTVPRPKVNGKSHEKKSGIRESKIGHPISIVRGIPPAARGSNKEIVPLREISCARCKK